jgi:hypothetical protein
MALIRTGWLYLMGDHSICITREPLQVLIAGPGIVERTQRFHDEAAADDFTEWLGEFLTSGGWTLQATVDRRGITGGPPPGAERRRHQIPALD